MTCTGCSIALLPTSAGYVHADTHNTTGADGHRAGLALVIPENVTYIDEIRRPDKSELPFQPVSAASVNLPVLLVWGAS